MGDFSWLFGSESLAASVPENDTEAKCSDVWELTAGGGGQEGPRCAFVRSVADCRSGDAFLDYVDLMYCRWEQMPLVPLSVLFLLCGSLVYVLAGNYVTSALVHLKELFRLDEVKAGATLLTLGNGLPDIMGAVTAVQIGHEGLVVGEVLGGTLFVVGVIVGSLYTVGKNAPLGPAFGPMLGFFGAAVVFVGHIYVTGSVTLYHIVAGLCLYVSYYVFIFSMPSYKDDYEPITEEMDGYIPMYEKHLSDSSDKQNCATAACGSCLSLIAAIISSILSLPLAIMIPTATPSTQKEACAGASGGGGSSGFRVCDANQFRFFIFPVLLVYAADLAEVDDVVLYVLLGLGSGMAYRLAVCTLPEKVVDTLVTFAGFILGLCFLHRLTAELVAIVRAIGLCLKLTDEVMGLSILTYGNFVGDISTYVAIVNRGCLQMALTGCISSVLMSLLFNITLAFSIRFAMTGVWYSVLIRSPVTTILMGGVVLCPVVLLFSAITFRYHSSVCSGVTLLCYYGVVMVLLIFTQL